MLIFPKLLKCILGDWMSWDILTDLLNFNIWHLAWLFTLLQCTFPTTI